MDVNERKILLAKRLLAVHDAEFLKKLEKLFDQESGYDLTEAHKKILDERLAMLEPEANYGTDLPGLVISFLKKTNLLRLHTRSIVWLPIL
jgi:hypothetical protein